MLVMSSSSNGDRPPPPPPPTTFASPPLDAHAATAVVIARTLSPPRHLHNALGLHQQHHPNAHASSSRPTSTSQLPSPPPIASTSAGSSSSGFRVLGGRKGSIAASSEDGVMSRKSRDFSGDSQPGRGIYGGGRPYGGSETGLTTEEEQSEVGSQYSGSGEVVETETITTSTDPHTGRKCLNQYAILNELGKGQHGKVRLARDLETNSLWAVKIISRQQKKRLPGFSSAPKQPVQPGQIEDKLKKEIAILKKLRHPNVVRLREVIDAKENPKVFLVLEYMEGGEVKWKSEDPPFTPLLTTEQTRRMFRDVVLGLEYLHHQGIIHRDIKPANLLWNQDHSVVKISDFGVSHYSSHLRRASGLDDDDHDGDQSLNAFIALDEEALAKTAGSPAFFAPELCYNGEVTPLAPSSPAVTGHNGGDSFFPPTGSDGAPPMAKRSSGMSEVTINRQYGVPSARRRERPKVTKAIDVWALGVTLYCLLFARVPFEAPTEFALFAVIPNEDYDIPEFAGKERQPTGGRHPGEGTSWEARELASLLGGMLEKDPAKRMRLDEVKRHAWVLRGLENFDHWLASTDPGNDFVTVTRDEVASAFTETLSNRLRRTASKFKQRLFHTSSSASASSSRPSSRPRAYSTAGAWSGEHSEASSRHSGASSPAIRQVGAAGGILSPQTSSRGSSSAHLYQMASRVSTGERPRSPSQSSKQSSFFFHPSSRSGSPRSRSKELSPETSPPPSSRYSMPPSPSLLPQQLSSSLDRSQSVTATSSTTPRGAGRSQPPLRRLSNHLLPVKRLLGGDRDPSSAPLSPSVGRASLDFGPGDRSLSTTALPSARSRSPLPPTPQSPTAIRRTLTPDLHEKQPGKLARLFGRKKQSKESREGVDIPTSSRSSEGRSSPMPPQSSYQSEASHGRASVDSERPVVLAPLVVLGSLPKLDNDGGLGIHFSQASSSDDHSHSSRWPVGAQRYRGQRPSTSSAEVSNDGRRSYDLLAGEKLDIEDDLDFSSDDDAYDEDLGAVRNGGLSGLTRDAGGIPRTGHVDFSMGRDGWRSIGLGANGEDRFEDSQEGTPEDDRFGLLPRPTFNPSFTSPRERTSSNQQSSVNSGTPSTIRPPRSALYNNTPSPSPSPPTSPVHGRFPPSVSQTPSAPSSAESSPTGDAHKTQRPNTPSLRTSPGPQSHIDLPRRVSADRLHMLAVHSPGGGHRARSPLGMDVESGIGGTGKRSPWGGGLELEDLTMGERNDGDDEGSSDGEDEGLEVSVGKKRSMAPLS